MKKLILTTIEYRHNDGRPLEQTTTRQHLVVINSSKTADENHDTEAAVAGAKAWFEKSVMAENGATYISITAEPTIDAENPEPPVLFTEGDLVRFGNYMISKAISLLDLNLTPEQEQKLPVWDSDIANWKHRATA